MHLRTNTQEAATRHIPILGLSADRNPPHQVSLASPIGSGGPVGKVMSHSHLTVSIALPELY